MGSVRGGVIMIDEQCRCGETVPVGQPVRTLPLTGVWTEPTQSRAPRCDRRFWCSRTEDERRSGPIVSNVSNVLSLQCPQTVLGQSSGLVGGGAAVDEHKFNFLFSSKF